MAVPLQGILFLGIIPALALLFIFLKGYDGHYSDRGVFLVFMAGIFLGIISMLVRIKINPLQVLIVFLVLFAFFEQLFKTIVLNISRFQERSRTIIYGLSLGLGFGAVFTPLLILAAASKADVAGTPFTTYHIVLITIGSIGIILFHAATGAFIGYGVYKGKLLKYLFLSIILQVPFNALFDLSDLSRSYLDIETYFAYFQVGLIAFGAIIFWYVITKIMPQILTENGNKKRKNE